MKRKLQVGAGLLIGAALIVLLFRDTDWPAVWSSILRASPFWLLLTQVPAWLSFFTRVFRWRYIVRSVKDVPYWTQYHATQIGFFANAVLPFRAGELVRALILARRAPMHFSKSVALVALDRVTDLFAAVVFMVVTLLAFDMSKPITVPAGIVSSQAITVPPDALTSAAMAIGGVLAVMVVVLILMYLNQRLLLRAVEAMLNPLSRRLARYGRDLLEQFAQGLHVFRSAGDMVKSLGWSLVTWGFFALGGYFGLKAFHLDFPWYTPIVLQTLLAVAVSVPGPPGFVGQYHLGVVLCLIALVPDTAQAEMRAVAIVMHIANLVPVIIAGIISLMVENANIVDLTRQSVEAEETLESADTPPQAD